MYNGLSKKKEPAMKKCRITAVRAARHDDLIAKYEKPLENACPVREGDTFVCNGPVKPEGLCESAWGSMYPFVMALSCGGGRIYGDWMKNERSAMVSCNDGFRPVSFYIEALDEDAE